MNHPEMYEWDIEVNATYETVEHYVVTAANEDDARSMFDRGHGNFQRSTTVDSEEPKALTILRVTQLRKVE